MSLFPVDIVILRDSCSNALCLGEPFWGERIEQNVQGIGRTCPVGEWTQILPKLAVEIAVIHNEVAKRPRSFPKLRAEIARRETAGLFHFRHKTLQQLATADIPIPKALRDCRVDLGDQVIAWHHQLRPPKHFDNRRQRGAVSR